MTAPLIIHGIVANDAPQPAEAPAHDRVGGDGLAALVSPLVLGPDGSADTAEALRHHAILAAYAAVTDVAPVRFGAVVADAGAARAALHRDAASHRAALARIAGCVEFGLRATARPGATVAAPPPTDGRSYLRARLAVRQGREAAQHQRAAALDALRHGAGAHAEAMLVLPARHDLHPPRVLDLAVLVARDRSAALSALADTLAPRLAAAGLDLTLTGPWPAYSFAAADEAAA